MAGRALAKAGGAQIHGARTAVGQNKTIHGYPYSSKNRNWGANLASLFWVQLLVSWPWSPWRLFQRAETWSLELMIYLGPFLNFTGVGSLWVSSSQPFTCNYVLFPCCRWTVVRLRRHHDSILLKLDGWKATGSDAETVVRLRRHHVFSGSHAGVGDASPFLCFSPYLGLAAVRIDVMDFGASSVFLDLLIRQFSLARVLRLVP